MGYLETLLLSRRTPIACLYLAIGLLLVEPALAEINQIPSNRLISDDELIAFLNTDKSADLLAIQKTYAQNKEQGLKELANYFKRRYGQRYYFHWQDVDKRFVDYKTRFPETIRKHTEKKDIHLSLYPADTQWQLPFQNLQGRQVTAYELRHLARQHKVLDMAYAHLNESRKPDYVKYFTAQMRSFNQAFVDKTYEDDNGGNGVFESYRAGTRVINWLEIHALFLGSNDYTWRDQIDFIRSMLLEGAILNKKNKTFKSGNHQTRGMNALAMLAILFDDYQGTNLWYNTAMDILEQHLVREVNDDGFQFERTVHYHIDDIFNYFYAFRLAKINNVDIDEAWEQKLKAMFKAMISLARPDKNLPVSSDDTDKFMAEHNEIDSIMLLGAFLFDDPNINYFASNTPTSELYWYLSEADIKSIPSFKKVKPTMSSSALTSTGFYSMRDGWETNNLYMNLSAGKSKLKPDHQHGDMLGVTAFGFNQELLPNYQVTYSMDDFQYFKNSFSKNVAIADSIPQGLIWKSNAGGSGFGKWQTLPLPRIINWKPEANWDYLLGTHNGFTQRGIEYYRKIFFLKGAGWIIKDIFLADENHDYQQIWQGHYTQSSRVGHHTATFENGTQLDIIQLGDQPSKAELSKKQGKGNLVYSLNNKSVTYTTLIYPHKLTDQATEQPSLTSQNLNNLTLGPWTLNKSDTKTSGFTHNADTTVSKGNEWLLFNVENITIGKGKIKLSKLSDIYLQKKSEDEWRIDILSEESITIKSSKITLLSNNKTVIKREDIYPGDSLTIIKK